MKEVRNIILFITFFILNINCSDGQTNNNSKMKQEKSNHPMFCDPVTGMCEIPATGEVENTETIVSNKPIHIIYFTDPICSACWGIEPQLRRLKLEYGNFINIEYRMGGLLPSWNGYNGGGISNPADVSVHWDEASHYYEMPIDGDVWIEDPLSSSYPPSIAFKAAQIQSEEKAISFLRAIREMVFLEKKNITKWEYIQEAAQIARLDTSQLRKDIEGKAQKDFEEDLDFTRKCRVRGFPTLFFSNEENDQLVIYGFKPYEAFEDALLRLYPSAVKTKTDTSWENLFREYPSLTAKEYSIIANIPKKDAEMLLNDLYQQGKIGRISCKNGMLWKRLSEK